MSRERGSDPLALTLLEHLLSPCGQFLNSAMKAAGLATTEPPVTNCFCNADKRYAFVEMATVEEAGASVVQCCWLELAPRGGGSACRNQSSGLRLAIGPAVK